MSRLTTGILSAVTLSLISGAAQLALGRDLPLMPRDVGQPAQSAPSLMVNRSAKSDRAVAPTGLAMRTKTISLRLDSFADTSFLLRLPVAQGGSSLAPAKPGARKSMFACEPVVSVLTEVERHLQPGRCVT